MLYANVLPPIGHSNGWLCAKLSPSLSTQSVVLEATKTSAIELVCGGSDRMHSLHSETLTINRDLQSLSIHLPDFHELSNYDKNSLNVSGALWRDLALKHSAKRGVIHADVVTEEIVQWLKYYQVPVSLENMDRDKRSGKYPIEVIDLCKKLRVPLALDLQHAFENSVDLYGIDGATEIAKQLATMAYNSVGISHLHVSGEIMKDGVVISNHSSLLESTNRKHIIEAIAAVREACNGYLPPIILEGDYLSGIEEGIKVGEELEVVTQLAISNMKSETDLLKFELGAIQRNSIYSAYIGTLNFR